MTTSALVRIRTRFPTAALVAVGLAGGFALAQVTGIRSIGGAFLLATGIEAARLWVQRRGWGVAAGLGAVYLGAFALSHVLALGAGLPGWLAVSLVTPVAAGVTYAVADRPRTTDGRN
jgi:hypothetical protein